tara:strand:+ start:12101 stop:14899 length:2799 start_codon:yes stop_codon:yes gene_type:complete
MPSRPFFADIKFDADNLLIAYGEGSPESSKAADVSSLYLRSDATDSATSLYIKDSGTGNTGWTPVAVIPSGASAGMVPFLASDGNLGVESVGAFYWDASNDRLGINTSSPQTALHVFDNGAFTSRLIFQTTTTSNAPGVQLQWDGAGTRRVLMRGITVGTLGAAIEFYAKPDSATAVQNYMTIEADGDVTIEAGDLVVPNMTASVESDVVYYDSATGLLSYGTAPSGGGGSVDGSGAADQIAYWVDSDTLTGSADFLFDGSVMTVPSDTTPGNLSITFDGDTNTGIQGLTGDQIAMRAGGETVAIFSYNVSAPQTQFSGNVLVTNGHVNLNDQYELQLQEDVANGNAYVAFRAAADMTAASGTYTLTMPAETPADNQVLRWNNSNSDFDWVTMADVFTGGGSSGQVAYYTGSTALGGEAAFAYDSGTNILTVDTISLSLGAVGTPSLTFQGDTNTGIYSPSADILTISAGGAAIVDFDNISTDKGIILKQTGHIFVAPDPVALTTPTYTFAADTTSGFGRFQSGTFLGWSAIVSNTNVMYAFDAFGQTFVYFVADNILLDSPGPVQLQTDTQLSVGPNCTASVPSIVFANNALDTGFFPAGTDLIGLSGQTVHWLTFDGANYDLTLLDESTITLSDSGSANSVSLKAIGTMSTSYTLAFPAAAPSDGEVLEWDTSSSAFVWSTPSGGGSGSSVEFDLTQVSPTLALLDAVYHDGSAWQKAQADDAETLGTHVVISKSGNDYTLCQSGRVTVSSHGLTVGEYYFTSSASAGVLTATEPSNFSNPLVYVEDANTIHVLPFRPSAINPIDDNFGLIPIWAEENSTLSSATYEWAFGNGANMPNDGGVVIPFDYEIVHMGGVNGNASGTWTVRAERNGSTFAVAAEVSLSSERSATATFSAGSRPQGNAGDRFNFYTVTSSSSSTPCTVIAYIKPR